MVMTTLALHYRKEMGLPILPSRPLVKQSTFNPRPLNNITIAMERMTVRAIRGIANRSS